MIFGVGIDIIEVDRLAKQLTDDSGFLDRIFTPGERAYCEKKRNQAENFAARFAAKEAFLKALGTGWRDGLKFTEIEVVRDELGKPALALHGKAKEWVDKNKIMHIQVSLSHIKDYATSIVILEKIRSSE